MFKLMLVISFMFIGTSLWAARLACDSCGSECAPACGTRRFRTCCFNYLRKKRGPENIQFWSPNTLDANPENSPIPNLPYYFTVKDILEGMKNSDHIADESKPYSFEYKADNRT